MDRRTAVRFGLAVSLFLGVGCRLVDRRAAEQAEAESEETSSSADDPFMIEELKTDSLSKAHKPGRSPGAWSSEAREIESHFNVR
ncbi:MAG: hypothetical protein SFX72_17115 [Isosphaeraceae bacterium]|nr:hypothetical protein [Isosphaeraceae bacterium]